MVEGVGTAADLLNSAISLALGDKKSAAISFASAVPIVGVFSGFLKSINKVDDVVGSVSDAARIANNISEGMSSTWKNANLLNDLAKSGVK